MRTYEIKRNGYTQGIARGKAKAVKYLKNVLALNGVDCGKWGAIACRIEVHIDPSTYYTIEQQGRDV